VKGLLIGAMVLHAQPRPKAMQKVKDSLPVAEVTVSMDSFTAIPPYLAYDDLIEEAAKANGLDADLIHAVIEIESAFNPFAVSQVGAQGLMQLMPALQAELGVEDPFDPRENIFAGARYLKRLLDHHDGNIELTLASYNAGMGNVKKYRGVPPFKETRNYVKKIKGILNDIARAD
jgi:soluble lytic murein transglycosylase-like protein